MAGTTALALALMDVMVLTLKLASLAGASGALTTTIIITTADLNTALGVDAEASVVAVALVISVPLPLVLLVPQASAPHLMSTARQASALPAIPSTTADLTDCTGLVSACLLLLSCVRAKATHFSGSRSVPSSLVSS